MNNKLNNALRVAITATACLALAACSNAGKPTGTTNSVTTTTLTGQPNDSTTVNLQDNRPATGSPKPIANNANSTNIEQTNTTYVRDGAVRQRVISEHAIRESEIRAEERDSDGVHVNLPGVHVNSNGYDHRVHIRVPFVNIETSR